MPIINQGWFAQCDRCQSNVYDSIHSPNGPMTRVGAVNDARRNGWKVSRIMRGVYVLWCPSCLEDDNASKTRK